MRRRTWVAATAAAGVIASLGLVATNTSASAGGTTPPGGPVETKLGAVTFVTSSVNTVTSATVNWTPEGSTSSPSLIQTVSTQGNCTYKSTLATGQTADAITPSAAGPAGAAVGYRVKSLGVLTTASPTGTSCSQINGAKGSVGAESLALKVTAPGSTTGKVYSAKIDVNLASNAVVIADLYRGGVQVAQAELQSGFSATPYPLPNAWTKVFACNEGVSNSGPQSKYNNNCYWDISGLAPTPDTCTTTAITSYDRTALTGPCGNGAPSTASSAPGALDWDTIVLTPVVGDVAVQGGAAYAGAPTGVGGPTTFSLRNYSEGSAVCTTQDSRVTATVLSGGFTKFTFRRILDGTTTNGSNCYGVKAYTASVDSTSATLIATGPATTAQWLLEVAREFPTATIDSTGKLVPVTGAGSSRPANMLTIDWTNTGTTPNQLTYCPAPVFSHSSATGWSVFNPFVAATDTTPAQPAYWSYNTDGPVPPTVDYAALVSGGFDQYTASPGPEYACVYGQSMEQVRVANPKYSATDATKGPEFLTMNRFIDWIYMTGDAQLRSP